MRKLLALLLAALLLAPPLAKAQDATVIIPWSSAAPTYTGPGDVTPFTAWYGLRAYSAAVAATGTQKALDLVRSSDSHTCSLLIATSGSLGLTTNCSTGGDNGSTASSWCNATTCLVSKFYDQTGGGRDLIQATTASQPVFTASCFSSLPCIQGNNAAGTAVVSAGNFTPATGTVSFSTVVDRTSGIAGGDATMVESEGSFHNQFATKNSANTWLLGATTTFTMSTAVFHAAQGVEAGASSVVNIDGADTGLSATGNTTAGQIAVFLGGSTENLQIGETGFLDNTAFSSGTRTSLCHNQRLYWGTTGSC